MFQHRPGSKDSTSEFQLKNDGLENVKHRELNAIIDFLLATKVGTELAGVRISTFSV